MVNSQSFTSTINLRLFREEEKAIDRIVRYARDDWGEHKFDSKSHFVRAAIIQFIRLETAKLPRRKK